MTNDDVAKLACDVLTEATFTALTDNVSAARLITRNFVTTRRAELRKHTWNFAIQSAEVEGTDLETDIGTFHWRYPYPAALPGVDIISNGAFASDTVWSKGNGWSIAAGVASKTAGSSGNLSQTVTVEEKRLYRLAYTISAYTAGTLTPSFLDASAVLVDGEAQSEAGTYTEDLLAELGTISFALRGDNIFAGSVDNVSLKPLAKTLRILPLTYDGEPHGVPINYRFESDFIYSDYASPRIVRFISDMEDPDDWDPLFVDVMAAALAVKIAHPITGKASMIQVAQGAYDKAVRAAVLANALERAGRLQTNSFALARGDTRGWAR